jgi:oligosaccharyl transferase (archaeosortase A-associated)
MMSLAAFMKKKSAILLVLLLFFMGVSFVLRAIPALYTRDPNLFYVYDSDTYFTLRQIEVMVKHFPVYNWFDPMTAYPVGKTIGWGPLVPFIAATVSIIAGATTTAHIISVSGWVSLLLAVMLVPVVYVLTKTVWDWKAGVIGAGLVSVVSFRFYFLSSYGFVDHHVAEVFFSTLFLLTYIYCIHSAKSNPVRLNAIPSLLIPVSLALLAGILYALAILTATTVLLLLPVLFLYTVVQVVLDHLASRDSFSLVLLNLVAFSVVIIVLVFSGVNTGGLSVTEYSSGLIYANLALIAGTVVLYGLSVVCKGKRSVFFLSLFCLFLGIFLLLQIHPLFRPVISQAFGLFFSRSEYSVVVQETLPWSLATAWANFNLALVLMAGGLFILGYYVIKERKPEHVFLLLWSVVILLATIQYRRFEYYATVPIVVLAAICISEPITWVRSDLSNLLNVLFSRVPAIASPATRSEPSRPENIPRPASGKKKRKTARSPADEQKKGTLWAKRLLCALVVILAIACICISGFQDYQYGMNFSERRLPDDWTESLAWVRSNTPEPMIDYYAKYDKAGFSYPAGSYGIMASWDAGHWITFFARRIPITNPFQDNLGGASGASAFFLSQNESRADEILMSLGGKYVITDSHLAMETFTGLVPWQNASADTTPYIKWFLSPSSESASGHVTTTRYDNAYFQSMVVRLHTFDGSMTVPGTVDYIQYAVTSIPGAGDAAGTSGLAPVIVKSEPMDASAADEAVREFNQKAVPNHYAIVLSEMPNNPIRKVPALSHYRLIHESPQDATVSLESGLFSFPGIKSVKIFEFVNGSHINGEGIIELPLITNTGREFVYLQESRNGEFVVPYSTKENPYEVRATGPYHIVGTSRFVDVSEADVTSGQTVLK